MATNHERKMNSKLYRCGWCGSPTDSQGNNLKDEAFKRAVNLIENYNSAYHVHLVHGNCCLSANNEKPLVQITRDMAIDAGDRSLEGKWINWV